MCTSTWTARPHRTHASSGVLIRAGGWQTPLQQRLRALLPAAASPHPALTSLPARAARGGRGAQRAPPLRGRTRSRPARCGAAGRAAGGCSAVRRGTTCRRPRGGPERPVSSSKHDDWRAQSKRQRPRQPCRSLDACTAQHLSAGPVSPPLPQRTCQPKCCRWPTWECVPRTAGLPGKTPSQAAGASTGR